jgi:glycosyltransferase involved in cell wall biosynthesis
MDTAAHAGNDARGNATTYRPDLVSIIVCTRNRAAKLRQTLTSIHALELLPGYDYEVIVVDNGSTDETTAVCASLEDSFHGRLRRIFHPLRGKSAAANAGLNQARGRIVAFLDDDILPARNWFAVVCQEFSADPDLGAISGRVETLHALDLSLAVRRQTQRIEFQSVDDAFNLFIGCNFAALRALIDRVGPFDLDIGPGSRLRSAEDADFFYRAWKAGAKLVYVPTLFVHHDHGQRTPEAARKVLREYLLGRGAFYAKHVLRGDKQVARAMYWELDELARALFRKNSRHGWRPMAWLFTGFVGYLLLRAGRGLSPRSSGQQSPRLQSNEGAGS